MLVIILHLPHLPISHADEEEDDADDGYDDDLLVSSCPLQAEYQCYNYRQQQPQLFATGDAIGPRRASDNKDDASTQEEHRQEIQECVEGFSQDIPAQTLE